MPRQRLYTNDVGEAVQSIIPYIVDTSNTGHRAIYIDGWRGLAASAVLRAIARDPPPSVLKKFDKIIHVDCSKWKSRRALQRTIAQELKLPHRIMDILDRQDEDDDFRGVDESSRAEVPDVGSEIHRAFGEHRCLVVFHNGSDGTIDLNDLGIPHLDRWSASKILWTFRGRLRLNSEISGKVDNSHLYLYDEVSNNGWNFVLNKEAKEIGGYTDKLGEVIEECCLYLLSLNSHRSNNMEYDWGTHASSYWVCDGIIEGGQGEEAWKVAAALHQHINTEDYSANALPSFGHELKTPSNRWLLSKESSVVHPESTSFFLASEPDPPLRPLPNDMFHQSGKLRVLKLCRCTFSFSAPPFCCCRNLKFLGLDGCNDQLVEQDEEKGRPTMEIFQSLWVLDICHTDWNLDLSVEITEQMAVNIREVHIKKGRIWCHDFSWRQLQNLHKLRVIEPTSSWQTGKMDEFTDTIKLEFLDLSGDSTLQVLPSLSGATSLKTLVLDGCVALEHLGPEALPPSLESFSLDARSSGDQNKKAKISHISLAGCARLAKFRLCGSLPNLEELDLSGTLVETLDLKDEVVQAPSLQKIILLGCMQLHAILWPKEGLPTLKVLHIESFVCHVQAEVHEAYATIMDIRFFQSLILQSNVRFCWNSNRFHLNICVPCSTNVTGQRHVKEKMGLGNSGKIMGPLQPKSLTPNTYNTYMDVSVGNIIVDHNYYNGMQFQPSGCHVEIGKGINNVQLESEQAIEAINFVMDNVESLHVHDNSSITIVIPEHMTSIDGAELGWRHLKQCHVVRCPKLHTVFTPNYNIYPFQEIETFWAVDLLNAHCIWSKGRTYGGTDYTSFVKLKSIHLYSCPRLTFVLPLFMAIQGSYLHNLESLRIVNCGDLKTVFPVHPGLRVGVLEFPSLKHIHLYELPKLQHICEVKMLAPKLERVWIRGCWGLKRLPAVGRDSRHPVVDCEKDWWEKLEWDGLEAGHHASLFKPRHSSHYKKSLPRGSVLW